MGAKFDVVTGLSDQDTRALRVLSSLCEKGLMGVDEARGFVEVARLETMERLCTTRSERKIVKGLVNKAISGLKKEKTKHRRATAVDPAAYYT